MSILNIMDSSKRPATEETRIALYENMGKTICALEPVLRAQVAVYDIVCKSIKKSASPAVNDEVYRTILSLSNYSYFMNIELCAVLRSCFRAKHPSERRYNLKFINIIILEGYKYLYGYGSGVKKSLCHKIRKSHKNISDNEFKDDFGVLDTQIKRFGDETVTNRSQRNLGLHYDIEPIEVYEMLMNLSEEEEVQRVLAFGKLLEEITSFSIKYQNKYSSKANICISEEAVKSPIRYLDIDIFRNNKEETLLIIENHITKQTNKVDSFIRFLNFSAVLKNQFKDNDNGAYNSAVMLFDTVKASIQLLYLYIDLASASIAYISSEYEIERRISLKQITIIIYEGFKKLYGLNNKEEETFIEKYIQPILTTIDDEILNDKFCILKEDLDLFEIETEKIGVQRQMSVHYNDGIECIYNMLYDLNPLNEFNRSLKFLRLLNKMFDFITLCIEKQGVHLSNETRKVTLKTDEKINNMLALIESQPNSAQFEKVITLLKKIRSGDLFKERFKEFDN